MHSRSACGEVKFVVCKAEDGRRDRGWRREFRQCSSDLVAHVPAVQVRVQTAAGEPTQADTRSAERRVGNECRSLRLPSH